ncbi:HIT family protein [Candidatus Woesearchaeota archaeon]|nr:HIT family protein [Candidatus Woesearchaeota archaeon]
MQDCIFCKIIKGEIPCAKVYEDENVFAFLDIAPVSKGHTLVIPKEHGENLLDISDKALADTAKAAKKIAKAIVKATKADGFNFSQNNGTAAGQGVMHFHFHIIPRFKEDRLKPWPHGKYEQGEDKDIAEKISSLL